MVIDLQKCVGCGSCALACKTENNTQNRANGQTYNWADFIHHTKGKFPQVRYEVMPMLCNHCTEAPCIEVCPVEPKAMFKTEDGITMINHERCIGCRACQEACPYSKKEVLGEETSVISFNPPGKKVHPMYHDGKQIIKGSTSSGVDTARAARALPPHRTKYDHPDYEDVRRPGVVEKCTFCDHRIKKGDIPWCVECCPAEARIFGDLHDKGGRLAQLLKEHTSIVLKPDEGTKPNVFYIRKYTV